MGHEHRPFLNSTELRLQMNANVLVVVSLHHAIDLPASATASALPALQVLHLDSSATVPAEALAGIALLVLEVDPIDRTSVQRLAAIKDLFPSLPVVAAIGDASVALVRSLVRQGVADIVALPFDGDELLQTLLDVLARSEQARGSAEMLAPMVAVVRSIGGSGATTIATHLAADLAQHAAGGKGVAIVDLDLQFGSVADYLGSKGRGTIADLLEAGDRLDEELVQSIVSFAEDGVAVIAAPDAIMPLEMVDTDQLLQVLRLLRKRFGYVVLDLPANWTNWTLSAALTANVLLLVVELSVASLRQAKRRLELFESVGIDRSNIEIVANRVERRLFRTINVDDISATLGHSVLTSIALEEPLVSSAQDQGQLVSALRRKSHFGADIAKLSELLRSGQLSAGPR